MNLLKTLVSGLPNGTLQLRVYDRKSVLSIIPAEAGRPVFVREYAWFEPERAERDFNAIRAATATVVGVIA